MRKIKRDDVVIIWDIKAQGDLTRVTGYMAPVGKTSVDLKSDGLLAEVLIPVEVSPFPETEADRKLMIGYAEERAMLDLAELSDPKATVDDFIAQGRRIFELEK